MTSFSRLNFTNVMVSVSALLLIINCFKNILIRIIDFILHYLTIALTSYDKCSTKKLMSAYLQMSYSILCFESTLQARV